jgi:endonuclease/exonuclease/phosphatase (EEP) superfamily protein YafD
LVAARRVIGFLGLAVLVGSSLALILRFVTVSRPLLALLVSAAPVGMLLGAGAVLVGVVPAGVWLRIALAGSVLIAVFGITGAHPIRALCLTSGSADDPTEGSLTVYSHNVLWSVGIPAAVAEQIIESDADVVMLQESDAAFVAALGEQLGDRYPYVVEAASTKTLSLAILSRWPLMDVVDTEDTIVGENPALIATVQPGDSQFGEPLRLANIHLSAPRNSALSPRWLAELQTLSERPFGADVLVGDFNASSAHKPFRQLLSAGYRDAHAEAGCGTGTTWTIFGAGPSLLHLDHVLVSEDVRVESYRTGGRANSDHRSMVVTVSAVD